MSLYSHSVDSGSVGIKGKLASIPSSVWFSSLLIGMGSFMFGYTLAALNSCLVTGGGASPTACYNGDDNSSPSCPPGSIYDQFDLSTGN